MGSDTMSMKPLFNRSRFNIGNDGSTLPTSFGTRLRFNRTPFNRQLIQIVMVTLNNDIKVSEINEVIGSTVIVGINVDIGIGIDTPTTAEVTIVTLNEDITVLTAMDPVRIILWSTEQENV